MNHLASRYVKPELLDTHRGTADPRPLVCRWLQEAASLLAAAEDASPRQVQRLLSLWQGLARLRPELLEGCDETGTAPALDAWARARGASLAAELPRFNAEGWRKKLAALEASYEEDATHEQQAELAIDLLTELDDAQLAALALHRLSARNADYKGDGEFIESIESADAECVSQADVLLPASTYVQAVGLALRPDLLEHDAELALTAVKFEAILAAAEEAEAALSLRPLPRTAAMVQGLVAAYRKSLASRPSPAPTVRGYPREVLPRAIALAAEQAPSAPRVLWWQSPDHRYRAGLALPSRPADESAPLVTAFSTADGQPARDLAGSLVRLAEAPTSIGQDAKARWTLRDVTRTGRDLVLEVGTPPVPWEPLQE
jgi:hypothetical protein